MVTKPIDTFDDTHQWSTNPFRFKSQREREKNSKYFVLCFHFDLKQWMDSTHKCHNAIDFEDKSETTYRLPWSIDAAQKVVKRRYLDRGPLLKKLSNIQQPSTNVNDRNSPSNRWKPFPCWQLIVYWKQFDDLETLSLLMDYRPNQHTNKFSRSQPEFSLVK